MFHRLTAWLSPLLRGIQRGAARKTVRRERRCFLNVEMLEERITPVSFAGGFTYDNLASNLQAVAAGNIFGHGYQDFAVSSAVGGVLIFKNDGAGNFTQTGSVAFTDIRSIQLADVNTDGKLDLVAALGSNNTVGIALGNGDGTFQSPILAPIPPGGALREAVGDFNGDGKLDVAVASGNLDVLMNNGSASVFGAATVYTGNDNEAVTVGDFNGDGKLDIATSSYFANSVYVYLNNGNGTFQAPVGYTLAGHGGYITAGDFLHNGRDDIAVSNQLNPNLDILLSNSDGTFKPAVHYALGLGAAAGAVTVADFDKDGKLDIAVQAVNTSKQCVFIGNGDGTFQAPVVVSAASGTSGVAAADVNGDGLPDLITSSSNSPGSVDVTLNTTFSISKLTLPNWDVNLPGYNQTVTTVGGAPPITFSVMSGDSLPTGLSINSSTGVISGTPSATGTFTFHIVITDSASATASQVYTVTINQVPAITTTTLPNWDQNLAGYNQTVAATGGTGALAFSVQSGDQLPTGLSINSGTGKITGTPTAIGGFTFHIVVTDILGASASRIFSITIAAPPAITTTTLSDWDLNLAGYNQTVLATGGTGALTFSVQSGDQLPLGLSINSSTGKIIGTPTTLGGVTFHLIVTDSLGVSANQVYTVTINPNPTITTTKLANWTQNFASYSQTVTGAGGTGTLTFSILTGDNLPVGLSLSGTGTITGTPSAIGASSFHIVVTDGVGVTASQAYTVTINAPQYEVGDFVGQGVYRYNSFTGWQHLTSADATSVSVDTNGDVVGDFGSLGVYLYRTATGAWENLTTAHASQVAAAGNAIVVADFAGFGVYRYENGSWQNLTTADATSIGVDANGDVVGAFGSAGVYRYEDVGGWKNLTTAKASLVSIAGNGIVAADFSGFGVYRYEDVGGWKNLTTADATSIGVDANGDVVGAFGNLGVYRFEDSTLWQRLTTARASLVTITGNGIVAAEFPSFGVYVYKDAIGWTNLTTADASLLGLGG